MRRKGLCLQAVQRAVWAARVVVFAAFVDLFAGFPIVAPYARELGASAFLTGLAVAAYSVANLLGNVAAGVALDRIGRKPILLGGLIVSAVAVALHAVAQDSTQLIALRLVHGLATAVLSPGAFALIGDAAPPERRARAMGSAGVFIAIAALVAFPMAGIVRSVYGIRPVFLIVAVLLALAAVLVQGLARERSLAVDDQRSMHFRHIGSVLVRPPLLVAYAGIVAFTIGIGSLIEHLPIMLEAQGGGERASSYAFTVYAVVAMIGMAGPASRPSDRFGRQRPLAWGLGVIGIALLGLGLFPSLIAVYVEMVVFGFGFALLFPAATALVADASSTLERGTAFGVFYAVYSLGTIIGALAAGWLAGVFGDTTTAPFLVSSAIALVVTVLLFLSFGWASRAAAPGTAKYHA